MSNFKGTKGKWAVYNNSQTRKGNLGIVYSWDENGKNPIEVASVYTNKAKANAKLIAHAPEMLEMLELLIDRMEENNLGNFPSVLKAKELIKKTTEI